MIVQPMGQCLSYNVCQCRVQFNVHRRHTVFLVLQARPFHFAPLITCSTTCVLVLEGVNGAEWQLSRANGSIVTVISAITPDFKQLHFVKLLDELLPPYTHVHNGSSIVHSLTKLALRAPVVLSLTQWQAMNFSCFTHGETFGTCWAYCFRKQQGFNQTVILSPSRNTNPTRYPCPYRDVLRNDDKVGHPVSAGLQAGWLAQGSNLHDLMPTIS